MKVYKYRGYQFRKTNITTGTYVFDTGGNAHQAIRYLYEIAGLKNCGKRPFITSVAGCKAYINECKRGF